MRLYDLEFAADGLACLCDGVIAEGRYSDPGALDECTLRSITTADGTVCESPAEWDAWRAANPEPPEELMIDQWLSWEDVEERCYETMCGDRWGLTETAELERSA